MKQLTMCHAARWPEVAAGARLLELVDSNYHFCLLHIKREAANLGYNLQSLNRRLNNAACS